MSKTQSSSDIAALLMRCADTRTPPFFPVARDLLIDGALRSALRRKDWYVATLDRAPVFGKDTLLHALYQSGEFPAYFGFNWDALKDTLCDFSWLPVNGGIALIWRNPALLQQRAPEAYDTFIEVLDEAAALRANAGAPPLRVLMPAS